MLLRADMLELRGLRRQEVFLSIKRYLGMVRLLTLVALLIFVLWFPYSPCVCFNWQAVQATYRLEEAINDQSKALELEHDKRLDATQTLKNPEVQTRRLLEAEDQLKIANKQIIDLKKKLAEAMGAKTSQNGPGTKP